MSSAGATRRVLFLNPAKDDWFRVSRLHMGFTQMGRRLTEAGHTVKIVDYAFLRGMVRSGLALQSLAETINEFRPDVIGISVFTYLFDECAYLIDRLSECSEAPIILGGPHFSAFPDDFRDHARVSAVVRGEADKEIVRIVEEANVGDACRFIECSPVNAEEISSADISLAVGHEALTCYQIQLSRGCPFNCSFCTVSNLAGHRPRGRRLEDCMAEIAEAARRYPQLRSVVLTDDCPTYDRGRFKRFLRMFRGARTGLHLGIDNVRADAVDEEFLELYVQAGGRNICLGVESGDPRVFSCVHKGENMAQILKAAALVHRFGLKLGACFVIGLPGDSPEHHNRSMSFAKALRPDYLFWNMFIPWPNTEAHDWYTKNGTIGDPRNATSLMDPRGNFQAPVCSTPDFSVKSRIRSWLRANMETHRWFADPHDAFKILRLACRYGALGSYWVYLWKTLCPEVCRTAGRRANALFRSLVSLARHTIKRSSADK